MVVDQTVIVTALIETPIASQSVAAHIPNHASGILSLTPLEAARQRQKGTGAKGHDRTRCLMEEKTEE